MKYNIDWIKRTYQTNPNLDYLFFWGNQPGKTGEITKSCLSQWWKSDFVSNGIRYTTAEQWMMARKAELFGDGEALSKILKTDDPKEIKLLGRGIKEFDNATWDTHKYEIVKEGNLLKFSQNLSLKNFLVDTGDSVIVEASPNDCIWGVGLKNDEANIKNPNTWKGLNLLGFALMEVRESLIKN